MAELDGVPVTADQLAALALVNYGHFTTMLVERRGVRGLAAHLERLRRDCRAVFGADLDVARVRALVRRATADRTDPCVARVTVFDPDTDLGNPGAPGHPRILVTTRKAATTPPPPLRLRTTAFIRETPEVKHVGLFGALWQRRTARAEGYDDALFHDPTSSISEGPTWNIAFITGDRVIWPTSPALPGITALLLANSYERTERAPVSLADLPRFDAAVATNATFGIREVIRIDTIDYPPANPLLTTLRSRYTTIPRTPL
ncbi:aminotransferase class IV family protein [Actinomadura atramentaria]|uniref:aminotransferase class IV family protein n=1 Tax=Actinomadura atramentaria TaxID=1990 RepID=UPI000364F209|nr:aminotransferase class IV family protein [Actinomadura atramentaria]